MTSNFSLMQIPYICLTYVPKLRLETHLRKRRSLSSFTWIICSCFSSVKMKNAEIIRYPSSFLIQPIRNMFASVSINMLLSLKKSAKKTAGKGVCLLQIICDLQLRSCPMTIIYYLRAKGSCCQHDFSKVFLKFSADINKPPRKALTSSAMAVR